MKRSLVLILGMLMSAAAFSQQINDPNVQLRDAKNFHAVHVSNAFNVYLTQSNEEKVAVSAGEQKYLEYIKVEVKNGVLNIGVETKGMRGLKGNKKLKAYISFKNLDAIKASGACDVSIIDGMKANELMIDLSGASDLKGKIDAKKLTFDMSGASDAKINGSAVNLDIDLSGACSFKGFDLAADYCNISASGASDVKITVNKELSVTASGASDVDYKGSGLIRDVKSSGSSSISRV